MKIVMLLGKFRSERNPDGHLTRPYFIELRAQVFHQSLARETLANAALKIRIGSGKSGLFAHESEYSSAAGARLWTALSVVGDGFFDGGVNRQELDKTGDLDDSVALLGQAGKGEGPSGASAVHEDLHQRANPSGVQEGHAAHVEDQVQRRFRAQRLNEIVDGFETELAIEACDQVLRITLDSVNIPNDFRVRIAKSVLDYDYQTISGQKFLLPMKLNRLPFFCMSMESSWMKAARHPSSNLGWTFFSPQISTRSIILMC